MKKIVRQQNYLKELIETQDNKFLSIRALHALMRAVLEPLLDKPESGVVLYRISSMDGVIGLFKRLEFSEIESYDFSDSSGNLREKVWANTEFLCVLTHRFAAILIWDSNTGEEESVRYYSVINSNQQNEALDIINRNSILDIGKYQERFKPDRRDNKLLNQSFRRILSNLDAESKEAVLGFAENQNGIAQEYTKSTRAAAHEVRNQLSICDLYSEIIKKYCEKSEINDETILGAIDCIKRAVKMASNSLIALKSENSLDLKPHNLKYLIKTAQDLTKVYFECKNIEYIVENNADCDILADEDKFLAILINLVKNAAEAFGIEDDKNGKYIKIKTEAEGDFAIIRVSNNAGAISNPDKIFDEGFTTKSFGSGLGLWICKQAAEEMLGHLELSHSEKDYTEFVIRIGLV